MTNPHLLGEEFARRYGASQTSSPDLGFAEIMDESDAADPDPIDLVTVPGADIMLASLNAANNLSNRGQAVGPLEAFFAPNGFFVDPIIGGGDDLGMDDLGEDEINISDVIEFDDDPNLSDCFTSPITMPAGQGFSSNDFAHLNNGNVTAFRRNHDPAYAASRLPAHLDINLTSPPFSTPAPRRRKTNASPYTSSHYKGVTPVQRMRDPNNGRTPDATPPMKKRKLTT